MRQQFRLKVVSTKKNMSITKALYGTDTPSRMRKNICTLALAIIILAFYGAWESFIPSHDWSNHGSTAALVFSAISTIVILWPHATGRTQLKPRTPLYIKLFIPLLLPIMFFGFTWYALVRGAASGITHFIGQPSTIQVTAWKEKHSSRRSCDYRLRAEELKKEYICLSEKEFSALPNRSEVTLFGLQSQLGFTITSWKESGR